MNRLYGTIIIPKKYIDAEIESAIKTEFYSDKSLEDIASDSTGNTFMFQRDTRNGWFEDLENLLLGKKVPYTRWSESSAKLEEAAGLI